MVAKRRLEGTLEALTRQERSRIGTVMPIWPRVGAADVVNGGDGGKWPKGLRYKT